MLKFENMQADFNKLMEEYSLPLRLTPHTHANKGKGKLRMKVDELYPQTVEVINRVYDQDFTEFGYVKRDPDYEKWKNIKKIKLPVKVG